MTTDDMPATDGYLAEWRERTRGPGYDTPNVTARMVQARIAADAPLVAFARDVLRRALVGELSILRPLIDNGYVTVDDNGAWLFTDAMRRAAGCAK